MKTIIGNWKMNLGVRESVALARSSLLLLRGKKVAPHMVICPSTIALSEVRKVVARSGCGLGAQNVSSEEQGAFTGETSARMLFEVGATHVIIGHSERRHLFGETDEGVNAKMLKALEHNLTPIVCVGETKEERTAGHVKKVILHQLGTAFKTVRPKFSETLFVAYEPVWAIGTGETPSVQEIVEVHTYIREILGELFPTAPETAFAVLYGGSVNGENAYSFLREKEIDGLLVGGASVKIHQLKEIVDAACEVLIAQS
ncbi:triose-phosphate isomerase [Candidatus Uhrbacteria bacterium RIFCSPHIGHO2_02_FULL_47_44]|uniref:Triosephosphate isomerase n=1 Tax=Candidatus Uhrbacteria bacterium RIFCSPLOWO2_02_FULL_48_18 TaxID=1802408 RepID=A0A1F7V905_9BACT|nr:MAG: triose-phosphate isomerase [Candidatus Uhrbacteria bacterium RIFCSPHIGHO2_01_FULL_47_10]OGL69854.1 MAG: triose-phosphate isomerase [Candidatus Uhrbacteria bacterium RIFCSPHIGHO2_02_FULL_47_44]OGL77474.1 MAG: triose-phosphate isomerase [Candidatus Uhrbacteria bacterium RIFCSPHIGHO2_12_FULL_47_12]OGL81836.1 MAG: triose-phosphate isomerase [Candidatus Uhrbacteria bacterium RIFCSPLOWO2_01_FULL_47_17]OGL86999.1 MAG: triose-phosphate isomerase [Candidatus Uhrbacteria bacterium RIFCSPLOWO2_02_